MQLSPQQTERFYRIWFALLHHIHTERQLAPNFPDTPGIASISPADAQLLRNTLWADDSLRETFIAKNPAGLPPADLAVVASWQYRVSGNFFVMRYLKKYTVFLSTSEPAHAYGVLGLVSPLEDVVGPFPPIYVQAVLLPFEDHIIYDSLLMPYPVTFGSGIRGRRSPKTFFRACARASSPPWDRPKHLRTWMKHAKTYVHGTPRF